MKQSVLILIDTLRSAGAENVAVNVAALLKDSEGFAPVVCATRYGGVLEEILKDKNVKYISLNRYKPYEAYKLFFLRKIIRNENVQIIHANKLGSNFWGCIFGKIHKIPVITHIHGPAYSWKDLMVDWVIEKLSDKIIAVSEQEKRRLIEEGVSPSKIVMIYNGINFTNYKTEPNLDIKRKFGLKIDARVIGISAGLRPEKKHETFFLAAKEVLQEKDDVYFFIVGDGARRNELEDFVSKLGISKKCLFAGFVSNIPEILSIIDIGVLSSEREGIPLALLEYMASSKPVISTNVGGVPEVVQDGINGFLVPPGDYKMLAHRMLLLLDDKDLASKMGKNGLLILKQKFTASSMISKIEDLYTEVLSSRNHRH